MSSSNRFSPYLVIPNGDLSQNIISAITVISNLSEMSYGWSWTGTNPQGTLSLQLSNDYLVAPAGGQVINPGTWVSMAVDYLGVPTFNVPLNPNDSNAGTGLIDVGSTGAYACRLIYMFASGSGTLNATFNAKRS